MRIFPYSSAVHNNNKSKPDGEEKKKDEKFICAVKECKVGFVKRGDKG